MHLIECVNILQWSPSLHIILYFCEWNNSYGLCSGKICCGQWKIRGRLRDIRRGRYGNFVSFAFKIWLDRRDMAIFVFIANYNLMRMTGLIGIRAIFAKSVESGRNIRHLWNFLDIKKSPKWVERNTLCIGLSESRNQWHNVYDRCVGSCGSTVKKTHKQIHRQSQAKRSNAITE